MVLKVFAKLRHKGKAHFLLVLPDGSRSYLPVAWTDFGSPPALPAQASCSIVASAADLLRLRERVDYLLRRIDVGPATNKNSPTHEHQHGTPATGIVECRTPPHSTALSTAHGAAAKPSRQPPGSAHSQAGAGSSPKLSSSLNPDSKP
jgi:hypothetical protein